MNQIESSAALDFLHGSLPAQFAIRSGAYNGLIGRLVAEKGFKGGR